MTWNCAALPGVAAFAFTFTSCVDPVASALQAATVPAAMKRVVAGLIVKDGKLLVCQRTRHQTMPLKWEFPGGKIEEGEQPRDALRRELEEELGILATIGDEVVRIQHEYPNGGMVELRFFVVREYEKEIENRIFKDIQWADPKDLPKFDFLEADLTLVRDLAAGKLL